MAQTPAVNGGSNVPAKTDNDKAYDLVNVEVLRDGSAIILPNDPAAMTYSTARKVLLRKEEEENAIMGIMEVVEAFPWDGAIAMMRALQKIYGWAQPVPKMSFFGPIPPTLMTIKTGANDKDGLQVIWGKFCLPQLDDAEFDCGAGVHNGRLVFQIGGKCKKKFNRQVKELADMTRQFVKEQSIYRGKAFSLKVANNGKIDWTQQPDFVDVGLTNPGELIFPRLVQDQVNTNVWAPIVNTVACRKHKVPLKRGILLEGPFGVGKTLLATVTARLCEENGWTFIMIDKVVALETALDFAKLYAPAVVFAEDVDRAVKGERSVEMDSILNTIDGIKGKGSEIITILTTNEVQKINKAMLRPGRLDAVISITPPDAEAAQKLMRVYARGLIDEKEPLEKAGKAVAGQIPAIIREVVERSKLAAIFRTQGQDEFKLTDDDLRIAAEDMQAHIKLLMGVDDRKLTPEEQAGAGLRALVEAHAPTYLVKSIRDLHAKIEKFASTADDIDLSDVSAG